MKKWPINSAANCLLKGVSEMTLLGSNLLDKGWVTQKFLDEARAMQEQEKVFFGEAIVRQMKVLVSEELEAANIDVDDMSAELRITPDDNPPM